MKASLFTALAFCIAAFVVLEWTDNGHVWQGLRECWLRGYKSAAIDDLPYKATRVIPASASPRPWPTPDGGLVARPPESVLDSTHRFGTVALAVVHRDTLIMDWATDQIQGADAMKTNAFSMAKTLTALAVGAAETEGLLAVTDPVSKHLPRFSAGEDAQLTIEQVLQMRSGLVFGESYKNPVGFMAKSTYGKDILDRLRDHHVQGEAGIPWKYEGGNTLLLQEILLTVTGMPLGDWFAQKIWSPIGAQEEALWAVDNRGHERNYCCFYSTASEYARLGQLLLDSGRVGSRQVVSRDFMARLMAPIGKLEDGSDIQHYGYQVWMGTHKGHRFTSFQGMHGQYIVAVHDLDLVAVRTGFDRPKEKIRHIDADVYSTIDMALAVAGRE